jgi:hypothetical protein
LMLFSLMLYLSSKHQSSVVEEQEEDAKWMINQMSLSVLNFKKIINPFATYKIEWQMILLLCTTSSTELNSEEIKNFVKVVWQWISA